ncbi:MAG: hypothetical protein PVH48_01600 [Cyclobacteriaceae bacterium]|jgi:hypothetical protein
MKARRKIKLLSLAIVILMIASANVSFSQDEYDDMYFNPADRKEVKFNENLVKTNAASGKSENLVIAKGSANTDVINPAYSPAEYGDLEESYSAKTVNPEYIERYKDNPKETAGTTEIAEGDAYYDDYYERAVMPGETEKGSENVKYPYPSSYYGGSNAAMRNRMYRNPWYDPFYGGGFAPGFSMGLGYSFGMMPGFGMSFGYGSGMGYGGYNPYGFYDPYMAHMGRYYDPFYSPWGYDPFYSPYAYNSMYRNSMMYGYGGSGFYSPYSSFGYGGRYGATYVAVPVSTGSKSSSTGAVAESNTLRSPSYRTRASRGSDQVAGVAQDAPNTRRAIATRSTENERVSTSNARVADRDFSRSQNEYYSRSGSRNATSTVSSSSSARNTAYTSSRNMGSSISNTSAARVRSTRSNTTYTRPSYKSSRQERSINSGRSWNSGTYRSSRSSGSSSYTPASRSGGSSSYGSSGSSFRSSGGSRSSGSISSGGGGSRSSGSSGASRSGRGN